MTSRLSSINVSSISFGDLRQQGRRYLSDMKPVLEVTTREVKVSDLNMDADGGRLEVVLNADELAKIIEFEDRLKGLDTDRTFRSSLLHDSKFEVWLTPDTQVFDHNRNLMDAHSLKVGDVVRVGLTLSHITYARTELGALWQLQQVMKQHTPKFMFDDDSGAEDIADTL